MVESRPLLTLFSHGVLILGAAVLFLPLWVAFVASTLSAPDFNQIPMPLLPGGHFWENYTTVLTQGVKSSGGLPVGPMMLNSLIMALTIAIGKIAISLLSAYAIVYFRFPMRKLIFWIIFATLMLPVEVRILPTYKVAADLGLLTATRASPSRSSPAPPRPSSSASTSSPCPRSCSRRRASTAPGHGASSATYSCRSRAPTSQPSS